VFGGPFVGWVCQRWSPRAAIGLAGVTTVTAAVGLSLVLRREASLRVAFAVAPAAPTNQPSIEVAG
jgi:hypothetical protein